MNRLISCFLIAISTIIIAWCEEVEFYVQNCKIKNQELCSLLEDFIIPYAKSQGLSPSHETIHVVFGSNGWIKVILRYTEPPFHNFWNDGNSLSELNNNMYITIINSIPVRVSTFSKTEDLETVGSITQYWAEPRESIIGIDEMETQSWTFKIEDGKLNLVGVDADDYRDKQRVIYQMIPPRFRVRRTNNAYNPVERFLLVTPIIPQSVHVN